MQLNIPMEQNGTGNIDFFVERCLNAEKTVNKERKTLFELTRYLNDFSDYCRRNKVDSPSSITINLLYDFIASRCKDKGPSLKKAVVWALRKFCNYLSLINAVTENFAPKLHHPKFHIRSELPTYLSETQVRNILEYAAINLSLLEFGVLSLMMSTGLRTNEVVSIQLKDINLKKQQFQVTVKGGWVKQTALCKPLCQVLSQYLATRTDDLDCLFVNIKNRPITKSWLRQMLSRVGKKTGLSFSLTPNIIRHTFATHAADRHGKVITKALMGHMRLSTTEVYTHLSPRHFKGLMNLHPYANS